MAVHDVEVCNSFHANPGDQVNFSTPSATTTCNLTADGTWPFTDGSPFRVPPAGKTTYMKPADQLPNGVYRYDVDCCRDRSRKSVTVP